MATLLGPLGASIFRITAGGINTGTNSSPPAIVWSLNCLLTTHLSRTNGPGRLIDVGIFLVPITISTTKIFTLATKRNNKWAGPKRQAQKAFCLGLAQGPQGPVDSQVESAGPTSIKTKSSRDMFAVIIP